jgi:hypothetical protein
MSIHLTVKVIASVDAVYNSTILKASRVWLRQPNNRRRNLTRRRHMAAIRRTRISNPISLTRAANMSKYLNPLPLVLMGKGMGLPFTS